MRPSKELKRLYWQYHVQVKNIRCATQNIFFVYYQLPLYYSIYNQKFVYSKVVMFLYIQISTR
jgi:hypothetical protein